MPIISLLRVSSGKLRARFSADQSSTTSEETTRTGMVRRLL